MMPTSGTLALQSEDMAALFAEPSRLARLLRSLADRIETGVPPVPQAARRRREVSEPVGDPYLDLRALARYSGMSRRWLEQRIKDIAHPLPVYRPGGKVMVKRSEFDRWMGEYRQIGNTDVNRIVSEVMSSFGKGR